MKWVWSIVNIKPSVMMAVWDKRKRNFEVFIEANVGRGQMLTLEAYDELDAWRVAEQYIKENM